MDRNPNRAALRAARRLDRLHKRLDNCPAVCTFCPYANPMFLIVVTLDWLKAHKVPRSVLQEHHLWGKKHDPKLTVPVCPNCHAEITEGYRQEDVSMRPEPDPIASEVFMLTAEAVVQEKWAAAKRRRAEALRVYIANQKQPKCQPEVSKR